MHPTAQSSLFQANSLGPVRSKSHTIAAYSVSSGAREKIEAAGGRCLTYSELMNENPTGSGVVILG